MEDINVIRSITNQDLISVFLIIHNIKLIIIQKIVNKLKFQLEIIGIIIQIENKQLSFKQQSKLILNKINL